MKENYFFYETYNFPSTNVAPRLCVVESQHEEEKRKDISRVSTRKTIELKMSEISIETLILLACLKRIIWQHSESEMNGVNLNKSFSKLVQEFI